MLIMGKAKPPEVVETSGGFCSVYVRWFNPFSWRFGSNSIIACSEQKWYYIINCQECQQSPAACWDKTHNVEESAEGTRM